MTARRWPLDAKRWHLQHGPIDLVIDADGDPDVVATAHEAAWIRFASVLDELVAELPLLREPVAAANALRGEVARRMWDACAPHRARFVTPMAAVAGAVADTLIDCYRRPGIRRAWVNNGGDVALHLTAGAGVRVGLFADLARFDPRRRPSTLPLDACFEVTGAMRIGGIATSGWRCRSFSFGIADSVTVLARTGAEADAAATMIANAVTVDDARIVRRPASSLKDDTDLGDRLVTVDVPVLGADVVHAALAAGLRYADTLRAEGLIAACALVCQRQSAASVPASLLDATGGAGETWDATRFTAPEMDTA